MIFSKEAFTPVLQAVVTFVQTSFFIFTITDLKISDFLLLQTTKHMNINKE